MVGNMKKLNNGGLKTIKVSVENHKMLNLYKIKNDLRTMDEAIGELLGKSQAQGSLDHVDGSG